MERSWRDKELKRQERNWEPHTHTHSEQTLFGKILQVMWMGLHIVIISVVDCESVYTIFSLCTTLVRFPFIYILRSSPLSLSPSLPPVECSVRKFRRHFAHSIRSSLYCKTGGHSQYAQLYALMVAPRKVISILICNLIFFYTVFNSIFNSCVFWYRLCTLIFYEKYTICCYYFYSQEIS